MSVRSTPILAALLLLLAACHPPEAVQQVEDPAALETYAKDARDQTVADQLSGSGLGKGDFARVEADMQCIASHFAADPEGRKRAEDATFRRAHATREWLDGARWYISSVETGGRVQREIEDIKLRTCPDGKLSEAFLADLLATP